jgi:amidase
MMTAVDRWGAFFRPEVVVPPTASGVLNGLTFSVKEAFAVKGYVTAAGNPDWLETHAPALDHAAVITRLLQAGATLRGTTHTDELMFGLDGENPHYGTPVNPRGQDRIPGGSSSGSAVAVAAGLADFALGTDTGGSTRIPASYCGIYGFRPTHGQISTEGMVALAPSFDTVGWLTPSLSRLVLVAKVLCQHASSSGAPFRRCFVARDAMAVADPPVREALAPAIQRLADAVGDVRPIQIAPNGLDEWMMIFRTLQGYEIWQGLGEWVRTRQPRLSSGVARRLAWTQTVRPEDVSRGQTARDQIKQRLTELLGDDGILVLPTAPGVAPQRDRPASEVEPFRARVLQLTAIAGLGGLPQVTVPWAEVGDMPVGLSVIAGPGQDLRLLQWMQAWEAFSARMGPECRSWVQ